HQRPLRRHCLPAGRHRGAGEPAAGRGPVHGDEHRAGRLAGPAHLPETARQPGDPPRLRLPGAAVSPAMTRVGAPLLLGLTLLAAPATAQRQRLSMDPGWRFTLGDPAGAEAPRFDDRGWRTLDLPHDWSIEGTPREDAAGGGRLGFYPTGIGWYRK